MAIEKIQHLLNNAPEISQDWQNNRENIKRLRNGQHALLIGAYLLSTVALVLGLDYIASDALQFVWASAGCIGQTYMMRKFVQHIIPKWLAHRFPKSAEYEMEITKNFGWRNLWDDADKSHILKRVLALPNIDAKSISNALSKLQNLDLPHSWWWALNNCVAAVEQENAQAPKGNTEMLNEVYIEIQQLAQSQTPVKHLKV